MPSDNNWYNVASIACPILVSATPMQAIITVGLITSAIGGTRNSTMKGRPSMMRNIISGVSKDISKGGKTALLMSLLTPLMMFLIMLGLPFIVEFLVPPIAEVMRPTVIIACMGVADTKMGQAIEATLYQLLSEGMKGILRRALSWCIPRAMKKTLPRAITFYVLNFESIRFAKPIAHGVVHTVTQAFTQQASEVLPPAIESSVTHTLLSRLQRYEYCVYCYYHGQYCDECDQFQYAEGIGK
jgi:hypothetical protein